MIVQHHFVKLTYLTTIIRQKWYNRLDIHYRKVRTGGSHPGVHCVRPGADITRQTTTITMDYIAENKKLELKYEPGKGAWTYHIQIPGTKHLVGKWGALKVAGFIDDYKIERINLFTITGQDKLISINNNIRKAINKSAGDTVNVTLYLLTSKQQITKTEIVETLKESGLLKAFMNLSEEERNIIIDKINSSKSEDKQIESILKLIQQLSNSNK